MIKFTYNIEPYPLPGPFLQNIPTKNLVSQFQPKEYPIYDPDDFRNEMKENILQ
jgi:hypothetical protein